MHRKHTYIQLASKYNCYLKTVQRKLIKFSILKTSLTVSKVIVLMDTTYWGRGFGVMLLKDAITKINLLKYYVKNESNQKYIEGIKALQAQGFIVKAIVCDGRKGLIQSFEQMPVQMCQFHQVASIRRYLTKHPELAASKEQMEVVELMKQTDKESFEGALLDWFEKWKTFLNERTINKETRKSTYANKKLRSAYRILKNNI